MQSKLSQQLVQCLILKSNLLCPLCTCAVHIHLAVDSTDSRAALLCTRCDQYSVFYQCTHKMRSKLRGNDQIKFRERNAVQLWRSIARCIRTAQNNTLNEAQFYEKYHKISCKTIPELLFTNNLRIT